MYKLHYFGSIYNMTLNIVNFYMYRIILYLPTSWHFSFVYKFSNMNPLSIFNFWNENKDITARCNFENTNKYEELASIHKNYAYHLQVWHLCYYDYTRLQNFDSKIVVWLFNFMLCFIQAFSNIYLISYHFRYS